LDPGIVEQPGIEASSTPGDRNETDAPKGFLACPGLERYAATGVWSSLCCNNREDSGFGQALRHKKGPSDTGFRKKSRGSAT
jgi:hypothetical protein